MHCGSFCAFLMPMDDSSPQRSLLQEAASSSLQNPQVPSHPLVVSESVCSCCWGADTSPTINVGGNLAKPQLCFPTFLALRNLLRNFKVL